MTLWVKFKIQVVSAHPVIAHLMLQTGCIPSLYVKKAVLWWLIVVANGLQLSLQFV